MKITFDPVKNETNKALHEGYDFAALTLEFFAGATILDAKDGRFNAIGAFEGRIISVIFKPLGSEGLSVISMRRASRKERKIHDEA